MCEARKRLRTWVEGIALAPAATGRVLLDAATHLTWSVASKLDDMEGIEDAGGVLELIVDGVLSVPGRGPAPWDDPPLEWSTMPVSSRGPVDVGPGDATHLSSTPSTRTPAKTGRVIRCGSQTRLDMGPHGIPRGATYPAPLKPPEPCRDPGPGRVDPLHPHAPVALSKSPRNQGTPPAGCTTQHQAPEHLGCEPRSSDGSPPNRRADHTDHNDQATRSSSREGEPPPEVLDDSGGRSPLITWDLDLYPQPPTNTHSPTLNSEEPV